MKMKDDKQKIQPHLRLDFLFIHKFRQYQQIFRELI